MSSWLRGVCSQRGRYITGAAVAIGVPAALYAGYMVMEAADVSLVRSVVGAAEECLRNNITCDSACNFANWCAIKAKMHPIPLLPTIGSFALPLVNGIGGLVGRILIEKVRKGPPPRDEAECCTANKIVKAGLFLTAALTMAATPYLERNHSIVVDAVSPSIDQCAQNVLLNCPMPCAVSNWCQATVTSAVSQFQTLASSGLANPAAALFGLSIGGDLGRSCGCLPKARPAEEGGTPQEREALVSDV